MRAKCRNKIPTVLTCWVLLRILHVKEMYYYLLRWLFFILIMIVINGLERNKLNSKSDTITGFTFNTNIVSAQLSYIQWNAKTFFTQLQIKKHSFGKYGTSKFNWTKIIFLNSINHFLQSSHRYVIFNKILWTQSLFVIKLLFLKQIGFLLGFLLITKFNYGIVFVSSLQQLLLCYYS